MIAIDFFTFVDKNTIDYAEFLWQCCDKLKSNKYHINWKYFSIKKVDKYLKHFPVSYTFNCDCNDLLCHGMLLNKACDYSTADYTILCDADVALLYKNWDEVIINELENNDLFGFGNDRKDMFWRVVSIPLPTFFCAKKEIIRNSEIDFIPSLRSEDSLKREKVLTKEDEIITGHKKGKWIKCDTGYKIAELVYRNKWKSKLLEISENSKLPLPNNLKEKIVYSYLTKTQKDKMREWIYNNELFGTHLSLSRKIEFNSIESKIWRSRIERYLDEKYGVEIK